MKIFYPFEHLELETILVSLEDGDRLVGAGGDEEVVSEIQRPYNRVVCFKDLELLKVIIIFTPHSYSIIIATTDQRTIIDPLNKLNIIRMPFKNILTLILIRSGIEPPNPYILIPTT